MVVLIGVGWRPPDGQTKCESVNSAIFHIPCSHSGKHAARDVLIGTAAAFGTFFEGVGKLFECTHVY